MALEVIEQTGRSLGNDTYEQRYLVVDTMSASAARNAVLAKSAEDFGDFKRDEVRVEELRGRVGHWLAEVSYVRADIAPPEEGDQWFNLSSRVETTHVNRSRETVGTFAPAGETPADFGGMIGVRGDGDVEGVDIQVPVYSFTVDKYLAPNVGADSNYLRDITGLLARVNAEPFAVRTAMDETGSTIIFQPHEVLLIGASAGRRGGQPWEFHFEFAASPNLDDLEIGTIAGIVKRGWDYLWLRYETFEDPDQQVLLKKTIAAYVEQLYKEGDFERLRIAA